MLDPAAARAMVLEKWPYAYVHRGRTRFHLRRPFTIGSTVVISSYCKTEDAAWLSAAKRIERQKEKPR